MATDGKKIPPFIALCAQLARETWERRRRAAARKPPSVKLPGKAAFHGFGPDNRIH